MNGSIYMIYNDINDKKYIGQTTRNVEDRFKQHLRLCKSNACQIIYKAIKKYGKDKFHYAVLDSCIDTQDELNRLEEFYISKFDTLAPNGYNLCPGGQKWRRKPLPIFSDEDIFDIISLYDDGESSRAIADKYSTNHSAILSILHKNGVEVRKRSCNLPDRTSIITKDILIDLFCSGNYKIGDIAKMYGVSYETVRRRVHKYNLRDHNTSQECGLPKSK